MKKKRVIFTSTRLFGICSSRLEHINFFKNSDWDVYVIANKDYNSTVKSESEYKFIEIKYPRNYNIINWIFCLINSFKIINKIRPDLIVAFNSLPIFISSIVNKYFKANVIMVFTGSGQYIHWKGLKSKLANFFLLNTLNKNANYIFQNPEDMFYFINGKFIPKEKSYLIKSSGVDLETFKLKKSFNDKLPFKVLMITRIIKEKGINEYLHTIDTINKKHPNCFEFTLAGEELKGRVNGIDFDLMSKLIENRILKKAGYISNMQEYLKNFDIFIYPSYYTEGVPRVCLESAAIGLPIITTYSRGCNLTVKEGETGFLVDAENVDQIVQSLLYFKEHPDKLPEFSKNAHEFVKKNFDKKKIDNQYFKLYQKFLN